MPPCLGSSATAAVSEPAAISSEAATTHRCARRIAIPPYSSAALRFCAPVDLFKATTAAIGPWFCPLRPKCLLLAANFSSNPPEAAHVHEQPDQARATSRSADEPIMQPYGEKLG